jgi:rhodanese-related sulfurtransferase
VEALSRPHYEMSHLPGAINLLYEFVDDAEKVLPDKRAEIVIYCIDEECEASGEEARELVEMGYVNVLHYAGRQAGLDQGQPPRGGQTPLRVREQTRAQVPA